MLVFAYLFQTFQLQLQPPSGSLLPANNSGNVVQIINIANPQKVSFIFTSLSLLLYHRILDHPRECL